MLAIIIGGLASYGIFSALVHFFTHRSNKSHNFAFALSLGYFALLLAVATINFGFGIFEQKFASQFSFDYFMGRASQLSNDTFKLQAWLNWPAYTVTGVWWAAIGTNCAAVAAVMYHVLRTAPQNKWILLAPAIINFSMFALRDPLIGAQFYVLTLAIMNARAIGSLKEYSIAALFVFIRPENLAVYAGGRAGIVLQRMRPRILLVFLIPAGIGLALLVLPYAPLAIGLEPVELSELPVLIHEFYISRSTRWAGEDGGGSNILDGRLSEMAFIQRYPIQVFTFFVLPLPNEINSFAQLLAFSDSIFFIVVSIVMHRKGDSRAIILFWAYVLVFSFFAANYGNMFRIRLPAYFIALAALRNRL